MSIIDIARDEAKKANVLKFSEIELEIGMLSGIEMNAFDFAWNEAVKLTILDSAVRIVSRPVGKAVCLECDANFKAWTFTIMKNIFINNYRKKAKTNTIIDSTDNLFFINSGSVMIENEGARNMFMQELQDMIDSLDDSIRIPFVMHFEGYKYQEIADEFELPLGTVKSRIFFARKALKEMIQDSYGDFSVVRSLSA